MSIEINGTGSITGVDSLSTPAVTNAAGSAASPSITFTGDPNTGIYSPGADQVAISTGGSGKLFIDSAGNAQLRKTSTPSSLALGSDTSITSLLEGNTGGGFVFYSVTGSWASPTYTERLRIDSSGRVGIGNTVPISSVRLGVTATTNNARIAIQDSTANTWNGIANNNDKLQFERWNGSTWDVFGTFDNSGRVGIGTTSPQSLLHLETDGTALRIVRGGSTGFLYNTGTASTSATRLQGNDGPVELYTNTTQPIIFSPNTTERARIDSSGRLLVGTSSARVVSGLGTASFQQESTGYEGASASWTLNQNTGDSPWLVLAKSRGTSLGSFTVVNSGDALGRISFQGADGSVFRQGASILAEADAAWSSGDAPGRLVFSTTADGASSPTERMRINNSGAIFVNSTTTGDFINGTAALLNLKGSGGWTIKSYRTGTSSNTHISFENDNGQVGVINTSGSSTSYVTSSDYRLKENVVAVPDGITRLQQLKPSRFNFIVDPDHTVDGFIAHEVQAIVPEAITGEKDAIDDEGNPVYQGIDQSKLVPLLTAALQEAIAKIETLEARLTAAGIE